MLRQSLGIFAILAFNRHPVLELLAALDQPRGQIGNSETVTPDKLAKVILSHYSVALEAQHVMSVELARQSPFDKPKYRQYDQRGGGADKGGEPKADADEDTNGGCYPDRGRGRQAAY